MTVREAELAAAEAEIELLRSTCQDSLGLILAYLVEMQAALSPAAARARLSLAMDGGVAGGSLLVAGPLVAVDQLSVKMTARSKQRSNVVASVGSDARPWALSGPLAARNYIDDAASQLRRALDAAVFFAIPLPSLRDVVGAVASALQQAERSMVVPTDPSLLFPLRAHAAALFTPPLAADTIVELAMEGGDVLINVVLLSAADEEPDEPSEDASAATQAAQAAQSAQAAQALAPGSPVQAATVTSDPHDVAAGGGGARAKAFMAKAAHLARRRQDAAAQGQGPAVAADAVAPAMAMVTKFTAAGSQSPTSLSRSLPKSRRAAPLVPSPGGKRRVIEFASLRRRVPAYHAVLERILKALDVCAAVDRQLNAVDIALR